MKNRFQLLLILAVFLAACNYSSNKKQETSLYQKDGLSFQLPKYWKVGKDRPIEGVDGSRFLSVSNNEPLAGEEFFKVQLNWVTFFSNSVIILSVIGGLLTLFSLYYFSKKYKKIALPN